jgi:hypothetical protein
VIATIGWAAATLAVSVLGFFAGILFWRVIFDLWTGA